MVTPAPAPESDELIQAPSNITGICDPSIQPLIDAALRGTRPVGEVIDDVVLLQWPGSESRHLITLHGSPLLSEIGRAHV